MERELRLHFTEFETASLFDSGSGGRSC
jgi:hypothetical protein